ncbi:MAG: hypothetical protein IT223_05740 [Crocinitomicaceae bacterium]|nr:hypothetical protein [Crocinitomicaceae bacterium]
MKKNHVKLRVCREIKYNIKSNDTTRFGEEVFDQFGRITTYTEYFAGGKVFAIYEYIYGEKNKVEKNIVKHIFNDFQPVEFILAYDAAGRLISRTLPNPIRNFWVKESFTYTKNGVLVKAEQWYSVEDTLKVLYSKEYPLSLRPIENSLVYLYDQKGLLVLHQFYSRAGKLDRCRSFEYSFY